MGFFKVGCASQKCNFSQHLNFHTYFRQMNLNTNEQNANNKYSRNQIKTFHASRKRRRRRRWVYSPIEGYGNIELE